MKLAVLSVVFRNQKKEVLLIKRRDVPMWALPGGGVDPAETPKDAAERELFEETGFSLKATKLVAAYFPLNRLAMETHLFECSPSEQEENILESIPRIVSEETTEARFFPIDRLPKNLFHIHNDWIHDALTLASFKKIPIYQVTWGKLILYFLKHPFRVLRFMFSRLGVPLNKREKVT